MTPGELTYDSGIRAIQCRNNHGRLTKRPIIDALAFGSHGFEEAGVPLSLAFPGGDGVTCPDYAEPHSHVEDIPR